MKDVKKLQEEYVALAASWGEALKIGDNRTANKLNSVLMKMVKKIQNDNQLGENVIIPLLTHVNPAVRLSASVDALKLGLQIQDAEIALSAVANDEHIHVIQLMAQISLSEWTKKKMFLLNQKDEPGRGTG